MEKQWLKIYKFSELHEQYVFSSNVNIKYLFEKKV